MSLRSLRQRYDHFIEHLLGYSFIDVQIPVCVYHGSREERAEIRETQMVVPQADRAKYWKGVDVPEPSAHKAGKKQSTSKAKASTGRKGSTRIAKSKKTTDDQEDAEPAADLPPHQRTTFPVVITTYEIVIRDVAELGMYKWGFIVVDEGHRLKNMECRLIRELKSLDAGSRMVLTGTPLHVSSLSWCRCSILIVLDRIIWQSYGLY